jgi:hypothetical protein
MTVTSTESGSVVGTYLLLRKAIGWIGLLLPMVVIAADAAFSSGPLPNSLSDFYYTPMRNILVGALSVLGVFLLLYDVSVRFDRWITNAAGLGVLGVAFLPGSPQVAHLTTSQEVIGNIHVVFASIAFIGLAITMWRFGEAISDGPNASPPAPRARLFYRVSACLMMGFVILSGVAILLPLSIQTAPWRSSTPRRSRSSPSASAGWSRGRRCSRSPALPGRARWPRNDSRAASVTGTPAHRAASASAPSSSSRSRSAS